MNADQRPASQVSMPVHQHDDEQHLIDYLRVVYKRRWVAIPACPRVPVGAHQQLSHHAALSRRHAAADREGHARRSPI